MGYRGSRSWQHHRRRDGLWTRLSVFWSPPYSAEVPHSCNHDDGLKVSLNTRGLTWRGINIFLTSSSAEWMLIVYRWPTLIPTSVRIHCQRYTNPFSANFDGRVRGISWLIGRNLNVNCSLIFFRSGGQTLCAGYYHKERRVLFHWSLWG